MNLATFERAVVVAYAYTEARESGSLDSMKAILYVLRNRVRAGWGDGTWLSVLNAPYTPALDQIACWTEFDAGDRILQMLVRDVDDVYLGQSDDPIRKTVDDALFWQFVNRDVTPEFAEKIVRDPVNHPRIGSIGMMVFYK